MILLVLSLYGGTSTNQSKSLQAPSVRVLIQFLRREAIGSTATPGKHSDCSLETLLGNWSKQLYLSRTHLWGRRGVLKGTTYLRTLPTFYLHLNLSCHRNIQLATVGKRRLSGSKESPKNHSCLQSNQDCLCWKNKCFKYRDPVGGGAGRTVALHFYCWIFQGYR